MSNLYKLLACFAPLALNCILCFFLFKEQLKLRSPALQPMPQKQSAPRTSQKTDNSQITNPTANSTFLLINGTKLTHWLKMKERLYESERKRIAHVCQKYGRGLNRKHWQRDFMIDIKHKWALCSHRKVWIYNLHKNFLAEIIHQNRYLLDGFLFALT